MNVLSPKKEDQQVENMMSIPKQICLFPHHKQNDIQLRKQQEIVEKFWKAFHNLQIAQIQPNVNVKYPFVIQISCNDFVVHLGDTQTNINNKCECIFPFTNSLIPYHNTQGSPIYPKMKLPIYKRRGVSSMQDEKETKNIPKNYCKSIITFACKNKDNLCFEILKDQLKVVKFIDKISEYKKKLLNIKIFSSLLQKSDDIEEEEYRRAFRIISQIFIKKQAISYIFNSKIIQHNWHMRYRYQVYKGVKNPNGFSHIKNL
ncbi:unnamed protein product [Paramecium sonneborni]|uniref:Uncharacterized protein n=1 Tax=Paramecium sonneborni TaxID=65129 RepID=A0A8S1M4R0_9CILI|nr:unnamed protein product [Paramecium sonneborni]